MRKVISILCMIMFCLNIAACDSSETNEDKHANKQEVPKSDSTQQTKDVDTSKTLTMIDLSITVGKKAFSAKLYDNQTTRALVKKFPITINMSELNGNEKYYYFTESIHASSEQPEEIHAGDIMLYGDNCIVLFYKTLTSAFRYTRLGYIEDAASFAEAVDDGDIKVTFDLLQDEKTRRMNKLWL